MLQLRKLFSLLLSFSAELSQLVLSWSQSIRLRSFICCFVTWLRLLLEQNWSKVHRVNISWSAWSLRQLKDYCWNEAVETIVEMKQLKDYCWNEAVERLLLKWSSWKTIVEMKQLKDCCQNETAERLVEIKQLKDLLKLNSWKTIVEMKQLKDYCWNEAVERLLLKWNSWKTVVEMKQLKDYCWNEAVERLLLKWNSPSSAQASLAVIIFKLTTSPQCELPMLSCSLSGYSYSSSTHDISA